MERAGVGYGIVEACFILAGFLIIMSFAWFTSNRQYPLPLGSIPWNRGFGTVFHDISSQTKLYPSVTDKSVYSIGISSYDFAINPLPLLQYATSWFNL